MHRIIVLFILFLCFLCVKTQHSYEICDDLNDEYHVMYCNLLDEIFPKEYFRWMSGYNCYKFMPKFTFKNAVSYTFTNSSHTFHDNITYNIYFSNIEINGKKDRLYYDYLSEKSLNYIQQSFDEDVYFQKWKTCAKKADQCCKTTMATKNDICVDSFRCSAIWDGWDCFDRATAPNKVLHSCPEYEYVYPPDSKTEISMKECVNATKSYWKKTNYGACTFERNSQSYEICDKIKENKKYKYCNLRDNLYPSDVKAPFFRWAAGYNCYFYGPPTRFKTGAINNNVSVYSNVVRFFDGRLYKIPYSLNGKNQAYFYDYTDPEFSKNVQENFVSDDYFNKWEQCSKEAVECCESMNYENICPNDEFSCPKIWDSWDCFPQTKKEKKVNRVCPTYIYTADPPCVQESEKECSADGHWVAQTDYASCQFLDLMKNRHYYHVIVLGVASLFCLPGIIIFFIYPTLRITRVILHRNLLIAIVVKNIFVMTSKVTLTIFSMTDSSVIDANEVPCRMLAFFERMFINMMYACMLIDGYYLHKAIVQVFNKNEPNIYTLYGIIAVLSLIPILIWAIVKATMDDRYCWIVDDSWRQWLIDGVRYFMLGVNTLFLLDILRVFISKWWQDRKKQDKNSDFSSNSKTTLRATLVLLPLFLIQFAMMTQRPVDISCVWDNVYYYFSYTMDSIQGIMVALLYCYCNTEVQTHLKRSYEKYKFSRERRQTVNRRKSTTFTNVSNADLSRRRTEIYDKPEESVTDKVQNWFKNKFVNQNEK